MADALRSLSVRGRENILFSPDVVGARPSRQVVGAGSVDRALQQLLEGTGLTYQRMASGSIIILAVQPVEEEVVVPEFLIVGRRTQNADIRRTENDIQPYQVATSDRILSAHADNLDQFLRGRLPSDAVLQGPSQNPASQSASNRSEANLHGLGSNQTLILVDGARLPTLPVSSFNLQTVQPDLNGLPSIAIDRVEILTGTAGGIYGPGATGGVINVVLKRDYRGADVAASYGISDRGDAARKRVDLRLGFTPDQGDTDVQLTFSRSVSQALPVGARDYAVTARDLLAKQNAGALVGDYPTVNGVVVQGLFGALTLKPEWGGTELGSTFTYLPTGGGGSVSDVGAILAANAGSITTGLSSDANGTERSMTSDTEVTAVLFNVRHRFGDRVEAVVDYLSLQNNGSGRTGPSASGLDSTASLQLISPSSPNNPFQDYVVMWFPLPGYDGTMRNRLRTQRLSTSVIVRLPHDWTSQASYGVGSVRNVIDNVGFTLDSAFDDAITTGNAPGDGRPAPNPFGDWQTFVDTLQLYKLPSEFHTERRNRFWDLNLRLAGAVGATKAGPISLSLLAERRREAVPTSDYTIVETRTSTIKYQPFSLTVSSLYAEMRAPLVRRDSSLWPLRGLETQLAVRYDENRTVVPLDLNGRSTGEHVTAVQGGTAYTAGARVFPLSFVMLRASIATGSLPPTPQQLMQGKFAISFPFIYGDPKRGDRIVGSEGDFDMLYNGSLDLKAERARTTSAGIVFNPEGGRFPRVALDYTHIVKHDEISFAYSGNLAYFLANEALYPDRIVRAPLTDADRAAGFTAGRVTRIDASALNIGRTWLDAVDLRIDHTLPLGLRSTLRPYFLGTWQPTLKNQSAPERAVESYIGSDYGPLEWRGNLGLDWMRGPLTVGFNLQYYGAYSDNGGGKLPKGAVGADIPAQTYLDLYGVYVAELRGVGAAPRAIEFRFGIQNLLDKAPRTVIDSDLGFSYYGDARRRRAEVSVTARF